MTLALWGGWMAIVYQAAPCGSSSDFLFLYMSTLYVCTLPTSSTSSHFLFPLLYPLPYLTPHSSHLHTNFLTLTPHTPHIDTENVFHLMVDIG